VLSDSLTTTAIRDIEDFLALKDEWHALMAKSVYPNVFLTWDFQWIWWKWYGRRLGAPYILVARRALPEDGSELVGIVPFYRTALGIPLIDGKRRLNLIGYWGRPPCPEYLGTVIRDGMVDQVVTSVIEFLVKNSDDWNEIFFEDYAGDDPGTVNLTACLRERFPYHEMSSQPRYYIPLPATYDDYLKTLSRHNRQKKKNRLSQAQKRFSAVLTPVAVGELKEKFNLMIYISLNAFERKRYPSPFAIRRYRNFHFDLLMNFLPAGLAQLQFMKYHNTPISFWYCFTFMGKAYGYQQGTVPGWPGSPGDVCTQMVLASLIEQGLSEFDFLRGLEEYKGRYTDNMRETISLYVYRSRGFWYRVRLFTEGVYRPARRKIKELLLRLFSGGRSLFYPRRAPAENNSDDGERP
jgi:hypothetical protein